MTRHNKLQIFSVFILFIVVAAVTASAQSKKSMYYNQLSDYEKIEDDTLSTVANENATIEAEYNNNLRINKELKAANKKMLAEYNVEKETNDKLKLLLSNQIEENSQQREEFMRVKEEFDRQQQAFVRSEMTEVSRKLDEYKKLKERNIELLGQINSEAEKFKELSNNFANQQEEFYQKQVQFLNSLGSNYEMRTEKYNRKQEDLLNQVKE